MLYFCTIKSIFQMKTIQYLAMSGCMAIQACAPVSFDPCRELYLSIAYDLDGWCAYDNPGFEFNDQTWCQSDNELLEVKFDPPYAEMPAPMLIRSKAISFGCQVVIAYLGDHPTAPPMNYTSHIDVQGEWSVITVEFSPAVYAYLTTPSYPYVDKKLTCIAGVAGWGEGDFARE